MLPTWWIYGENSENIYNGTVKILKILLYIVYTYIKYMLSFKCVDKNGKINNKPVQIINGIISFKSKFLFKNW